MEALENSWYTHTYVHLCTTEKEGNKWETAL